MHARKPLEGLVPAVACALIALGGGVAWACPDPSVSPQAESTPDEAVAQAPPAAPAAAPEVNPFRDRDPNDPLVKAFAQAQMTRHAKDRELRVLRSKYFVSIRNPEIRNIGISRLREYTDPAVFPSLLNIFRYDGNDVRGAILDHIAAQKSDDGDATLAWVACFDKDAWWRNEAAKRLAERTEQSGGASNRVKMIIANALANKSETTAGAAAGVINTLGLIEAIPALINAQVVGSGGNGGGNNGDTSLAYIMIATQQAFVRDLTPVVGDSAVGFDPDLGVVSDGVYLRVLDASVVTYRTEVHSALVALTTKAWGGHSTEGLGYDQVAWANWYKQQYLPYRKEQEAAAKAKGDAPADPAQPKS